MLKWIYVFGLILSSWTAEAGVNAPLASWDVPTYLVERLSTVIHIQLASGGHLQVEERVYRDQEHYVISRGIRGRLGIYTQQQLESHLKKLSQAELMSQPISGPCETMPRIREARELKVRGGWSETTGVFSGDLRTVYSRQHCSVPESIEPLYERDEALQLAAALETLGHQFLSGQ